MTTSAADRWCYRIVELAARMLPAEQRQRYAREFTAELYGMPRSQQFRYSAQVLAHAWALRIALSSTLTQKETTMIITTRRTLRCLVRRHQWHNGWDEDRHQTVWTCKRCGARRRSDDMGDAYLLGGPSGGYSGP